MCCTLPMNSHYHDVHRVCQMRSLRSKRLFTPIVGVLLAVSLGCGSLLPLLRNLTWLSSRCSCFAALRRLPG